MNPEPDVVSVKVGGDLAGSGSARRKITRRCPLHLDLTAVKHVDRAGKYLLALVRFSGERLVASGVMMTELFRTIADDWPVKAGF